MLILKPWTWNDCDEKLTSICVWPPISHRHQVRLIESVLLRTQLVSKVMTPNGLSPSSVSIGATCLAHEALDNSVENEAIVESFFGKFYEVLTCFGSIIDKELNVNVAHGGLEDDLPFLGGFLLEFLDHNFLLVGSFIDNIAEVAIGKIGLASGEDVESIFLKGGAIYGGVCGFSLSLCIA